MVILGFLAVLVARELPPARRWIAYVAGGLSALAIALSRLYLGVHWFSDVLGGMALGLAWVALLGIAYRRHPAPAVSLAGLVTVSILILGVAGLWHVERSLAGDLRTYAPRHPVRTATAADWWAGRLSGLPRYRIDIEGRPEHPLTLQWTGGLTAIRGRLAAHGWHAAPDTGIGTPLRWLIPDPAIKQLPVLPQVHDDRHGELVMLRDLDHDRRRVLRLWPADVVLQPGDVPLWVGNVATQYADRSLPLFTVARTEADFTTPVAALARELADVELLWAQPPGGDGPPLLRLRERALTAPSGAE
jgi:undecaprenyl-diphosphatase